MIKNIPHYKHIKRSKFDFKAITLLAMVAVIISCALLMPKTVFCADTNLEEISQELNNSVIDELENIDFSAFDDIIKDFESSDDNIFSINSI